MASPEPSDLDLFYSPYNSFSEDSRLLPSSRGQTFFPLEDIESQDSRPVKQAIPFEGPEFAAFKASLAGISNPSVPTVDTSMSAWLYRAIVKFGMIYGVSFLVAIKIFAPLAKHGGRSLPVLRSDFMAVAAVVGFNGFLNGFFFENIVNKFRRSVKEIQTRYFSNDIPTAEDISDAWLRAEGVEPPPEVLGWFRALSPVVRRIVKNTLEISVALLGAFASATPYMGANQAADQLTHTPEAEAKMMMLVVAAVYTAFHWNGGVALRGDAAKGVVKLSRLLRVEHLLHDIKRYKLYSELASLKGTQTAAYKAALGEIVRLMQEGQDSELQKITGSVVGVNADYKPALTLTDVLALNQAILSKVTISSSNSRMQKAFNFIFEASILIAVTGYWFNLMDKAPDMLSMIGIKDNNKDGYSVSNDWVGTMLFATFAWLVKSVGQETSEALLPILTKFLKGMRNSWLSGQWSVSKLCNLSLTFAQNMRAAWFIPMLYIFSYWSCGASWYLNEQYIVGDNHWSPWVETPYLWITVIFTGLFNAFPSAGLMKEFLDFKELLISKNPKKLEQIAVEKYVNSLIGALESTHPVRDIEKLYAIAQLPEAHKPEIILKKMFGNVEVEQVFGEGYGSYVWAVRAKYTEAKKLFPEFFDGYKEANDPAVSSALQSASKLQNPTATKLFLWDQRLDKSPTQQAIVENGKIDGIPLFTTRLTGYRPESWSQWGRRNWNSVCSLFAGRSRQPLASQEDHSFNPDNLEL